MSNEEVFIRLVWALGLGMIIGFERIFMGHEAGVRTHGLVSMGSCLFIVVAIFASAMFNVNQNETVRVVGQIVSGIGFLGAGLIFINQKENKKKGLTSAATLWATSAIGCACGFGLTSVAAMTTGLTLFTLTFMATVEWSLVRLLGDNKKK